MDQALNALLGGQQQLGGFNQAALQALLQQTTQERPTPQAISLFSQFLSQQGGLSGLQGFQDVAQPQPEARAAPARSGRARSGGGDGRNNQAGVSYASRHQQVGAAAAAGLHGGVIPAALGTWYPLQPAARGSAGVVGRMAGTALTVAPALICLLFAAG